MKCEYFGQDILSLSLGLATYIASCSDDANLLNFIGNLLTLTGQQIITIASAKAYYCPPTRKSDSLFS